MKNLPKGGSFLLGPTDPVDIFTPEDFTDEHKMIFRTAMGFVKDNVLAYMDDLEDKKEGMNRKLIKDAGDLGLLGTETPAEYGGMEMDKISTGIITECMGWGGSFAMTQGGQAGIGQLPLIYFGTPEQKMKYLPEIVSGNVVSAYALTEPGAGSDAMNIKTWAALSEDGKHYIINGSKQFITNGALADLLIVFAKIDREKFTGFIVDRDTEGITIGPDEHKMGIKGSCTNTVIFEDVKVPVENVLFEIGRGHVIAFNVLNMGRYKLAGNALGNMKYALELSATYANERKQFNKPLADLGLIQEKLAEMNTKTYITESVFYRMGGLLDNMMHSLDTSGPDGGRITARGIEEYSMECSMNKIIGTEALGDVVDEGVQIHGGYGYISEYPIERLYRDARVYRIFEGTNEVNRIVVMSSLVKRSQKGDIPLKEAIAEVKAQIAGGVPLRKDESDLVQAAKDILLLVLGAAIDKYGDAILKHQAVVGKLADICMYTFAMESAWLRALKADIGKDNVSGAELKMSMAANYINVSIGTVFNLAKEIIAALAQGEELAKLMEDLLKLGQYTPKNTIALRKKIAAAVSAEGKYAV